ncbi:MAG TPA: cation:proton antiporter [Candidatus Limnocylindrales bacterium]|jgi:CPA1 family monovalent cation:H+ antiporter
MHDLEALAPLWLLVALLGASIAVAILTRRWNLPTSVVLVVVGLIIALALPALHVSPAVLVRPELLLAIVLPGLVFEAAFRADLGTIRPAAPAILMLGIPGVVVVAGIVAVLLSATTGISPGEAFLVGSMVAATDPAAVLATFRHLPVPARLATLVEMESLVNDGTGIVLFALALDLLAGHGSFGIALVSFVVVVVGSSLLGGALGWAAVRLVGRVDEHVVELTITIVLAYGTYLLADTLGGSGVIATLVAAGAFGAGARGALTDRSLAAIDSVWELVAFLLTASVFLLVGVSIVPGTLVHAVGPIVWGVVATLVARGVVVYGLLGGGSRLVGRMRRRPAVDDPSGGDETPGSGLGLGPVPTSWLHVLFWAGLRGAVSVALALSLPPDLPNRELLQGITFGIVLFTLLVQGTTVNAVVRRSGALATEPRRDRAPVATADRA